MKQKLRLWLLVAFVSTASAGFLALWVPFDASGFQPSDFSDGLFLLHWVVYLLPCFIGSWILLGLLKLIRVFFKWLLHWRNFKWFLLAFGIFLGLIPLFYAEEDWRGRHAWQSFKREYEASGEKFEFAEFIPARVPEQDNFALAPVVASSYSQYLDADGHRLGPMKTNVINRLKIDVFRSQNSLVNSKVQLLGWQTGRFTDLKAWQAYYRAMFATNRYPAGLRPFPESGAVIVSTNSDPQNTNEVIDVEAFATNEFPMAASPQAPAADVLLALGKYDRVIEDLRQAAQRPQSRFPLDYDNELPEEILLPHYDGLKRCVQVLSLRATAELAAGKSAEALADIQLGLRLIESIRTEPALFAQGTRAGWFSYVMQPVWEGVAQQRWAESQLAELELSLARLDFLADFAAGLRGECAVDVQVVEYCRIKNNSVITDMWNSDAEEMDFGERLDLLRYRIFPNGWYDLGKKAVCRSWLDGVLPAVDLPRRILSPEIYAAAIGPVYYDLNRRVPWNIWVRMLCPDTKPERFAQAQTEVDLARLACALERYRLAHDAFPDSLESLSPQFIAGIPHDVINGQPLHYRRTEDGKFLLYSVGWDDRDDGGVLGWKRTFGGSQQARAGDWVWVVPGN